MANKKFREHSAEIIWQQLMDLSKSRGRPFDEILRYYAIERFLYRLSISPYSTRFFLKGGLMLKVWNPNDHRATMDIDFLAKTSNEIEKLKNIITEIAAIQNEEDAIFFNTQNLIIRKTQLAGEYHGVNVNFFAQFSGKKVPMLIDIGFNDVIIPGPQKIRYTTLLNMSEPQLIGYTLETIFAEKFESIVKIGLINTRMKDFYDLWSILQMKELDPNNLKIAINEIFANRGTRLSYPVAFTPIFYKHPETERQWRNFLSTMGKTNLGLQQVIKEISEYLSPLIENVKLIA